MLIRIWMAAVLLLFPVGEVEAQPEPDQDPKLKELLPGLFVAEGVVEFVGEIAMDCHHPDTPDVYLEMLVTAPDSREHESLVVADIKPSLLHAALLAAGFESGNPLQRDAQGKLVPATGSQLRVFVSIDPSTEKPDEERVYIPIEQWVVDVETGESLSDSRAWNGLVFAGSLFNKFGYAADMDGTLISLTSFGNEVVAPTWTVSSSAQVDEPVWIANRDLVPQLGEKVHIRIRSNEEKKDDDVDTKDSHEPDGIDINRDL